MNRDFISLKALGLGLDTSQIFPGATSTWKPPMSSGPVGPAADLESPASFFASNKALIIGGAAVAIGLLLLVALASRR